MIRPLIENALALKMRGGLVVELDKLTPITKSKFKPGIITRLDQYEDAGLSKVGQLSSARHA